MHQKNRHLGTLATEAFHRLDARLLHFVESRRTATLGCICRFGEAGPGAIA